MVLREAVLAGEVERAKLLMLTGYEERGARDVDGGVMPRAAAAGIPSGRGGAVVSKPVFGECCEGVGAVQFRNS